uniref:SCP2 domain-containing protein n=2 Tax=Panagrellus redivivus TaxID=6233 RepID=A0A7E4WC11_PANRE
MRFSAIADDSKSVEALTTAISSAAKYSKQGVVSVKILPDSLSFVCATGVRDGFFMEIRMEQQEVFSAFHMEGLAPDNNAIVFEMDLTQLMQAMTIKEEATKWKLVKRNNLPHLAIEMRVNAILKYIPVMIHCER